MKERGKSGKEGRKEARIPNEKIAVSFNRCFAFIDLPPFGHPLLLALSIGISFRKLPKLSFEYYAGTRRR